MLEHHFYMKIFITALITALVVSLLWFLFTTYYPNKQAESQKEKVERLIEEGNKNLEEMYERDEENAQRVDEALKNLGIK